MGIGAGLIYLPAMAVQAHHDSESVSDGDCHNRCVYHLHPLAKYLTNAGSSFGGIVYPIQSFQ
jgi:hypothetical protein